MALIKGRWVGVGWGWWGWVGGQAEGGPSLPLGSVGERDVHQPPDRSRWPLPVVWYTTNSD